jgi:HD superfamily phosphohydrolase
MATKQQKLLEETAEKVSSASGAITEIAEKASSAVTGLDSISKGNSDVLDANKAVLKRMNVGFLLGSASMLATLAVSGLLFYFAKSEMDKSNEMLIEAVALFAANVEEMTIAQKNVNAYFEQQQQLQNEVTYAREALEFIPKDIGKTLQAIVPQIQGVLENSAERTEADIADLTGLAIADLTQKITRISEDVEALNDSVTANILANKRRETSNSTAIVNAETDESTETPEYGLPQVRSDFEQVILLQKELSAKLSTLKQDAPKQVAKKSIVPTKPKAKTPQNPFKYP